MTLILLNSHKGSALPISKYTVGPDCDPFWTIHILTTFFSVITFNISCHLLDLPSEGFTSRILYVYFVSCQCSCFHSLIVSVDFISYSVSRTCVDHGSTMFSACYFNSFYIYSNVKPDWLHMRGLTGLFTGIICLQISLCVFFLWVDILTSFSLSDVLLLLHNILLCKQ